MVAKASVGVFMTPRKKLITFKPDMEMLEAVEILKNNRISGAPVVNDSGEMVGLLSEKDCLSLGLNAFYHNQRGGLVSEFMSTKISTVDISASIVDVSEMFLDCNYRRLPVVDRLDNDALVGQISRHDLLRAITVMSHAEPD